MNILSNNWPIFFLLFCSLSQSQQQANTLPSSVEAYLKMTDEIISKSHSYDRVMKGIRENWESPFIYLLRRGYIPAEDAAPDKMSRQAIEDMKKEYNHASSDSMGLDNLNQLCDIGIDSSSFSDTKQLRRHADVSDLAALATNVSAGSASLAIAPSPSECLDILTSTTACPTTVCPTDIQTILPTVPGELPTTQSPNIITTTTKTTTTTQTPVIVATVPSPNRPSDEEFYDFYDNVTECYYYDDTSQTTIRIPYAGLEETVTKVNTGSTSQAVLLSNQKVEPNSLTKTETATQAQVPIVETTTQEALVNNRIASPASLTQVETSTQATLLNNAISSPSSLFKIEATTQGAVLNGIASPASIFKVEVATQGALLNNVMTSPASFSKVEIGSQGPLAKNAVGDPAALFKLETATQVTLPKNEIANPIALSTVQTSIPAVQPKNEITNSLPLPVVETTTQGAMLNNGIASPASLSKAETATQSLSKVETATIGALPKYDLTNSESSNGIALPEYKKDNFGSLSDSFSKQFESYGTPNTLQNGGKIETPVNYDSTRMQGFQDPTSVLAQMLLKQKAYRLAHEENSTPQVSLRQRGPMSTNYYSQVSLKQNPSMSTNYYSETPEVSMQNKIYPKIQVSSGYGMSSESKPLPNRDRDTPQFYPNYGNTPKLESLSQNLQNSKTDSINYVNNLNGDNQYLPLPNHAEDLDNNLENKNFFMTSQAALDLAQKIAENTVQKYSKIPDISNSHIARTKIKRSMNPKDLQNMCSNVAYTNDIYPGSSYYSSMDWLNSKKPLQNNLLNTIDVPRSPVSTPVAASFKDSYGLSNLPLIPGWNAEQSKRFNAPAMQPTSMHSCGYQSTPLLSSFPSAQNIFPSVHLPNPSFNQQTIFQNTPLNEVYNVGHAPSESNYNVENIPLESIAHSSSSALQPNHSQLKSEARKNVTTSRHIQHRSNENERVFSFADPQKKDSGELEIEEELSSDIKNNSNSNSNSLPNSDRTAKRNEYIIKNTDDKPESYIALNALYVINKKSDSKEKESENENAKIHLSTADHAGLKGTTVPAMGQDLKSKPELQNSLELDKSGKKQQIVENIFWDFPKYDSVEKHESRIRRKIDRKKSHSSFTEKQREWDNGKFSDKLLEMKNSKRKECEDSSYNNLVSQSEKFESFSSPSDAQYEQERNPSNQLSRNKNKFESLSTNFLDTRNQYGTDDVSSSLNDIRPTKSDFESKKHNKQSPKLKDTFRSLSFNSLSSGNEFGRSGFRKAKNRNSNLDSQSTFGFEMDDSDLDQYKANNQNKESQYWNIPKKSKPKKPDRSGSRLRNSQIKKDSMHNGNPEKLYQKPKSRTSAKKYSSHEKTPSKKSFSPHNKAAGSRGSFTSHNKAAFKGSGSHKGTSNSKSHSHSKISWRGNSGLHYNAPIKENFGSYKDVSSNKKLNSHIKAPLHGRFGYRNKSPAKEKSDFDKNEDFLEGFDSNPIDTPRSFSSFRSSDSLKNEPSFENFDSPQSPASSSSSYKDGLPPGSGSSSSSSGNEAGLSQGASYSGASSSNNNYGSPSSVSSSSSSCCGAGYPQGASWCMPYSSNNKNIRYGSASCSAGLPHGASYCGLSSRPRTYGSCGGGSCAKSGSYKSCGSSGTYKNSKSCGSSSSCGNTGSYKSQPYGNSDSSLYGESGRYKSSSTFSGSGIYQSPSTYGNTDSYENSSPYANTNPYKSPSTYDSSDSYKISSPYGGSDSYKSSSYDNSDPYKISSPYGGNTYKSPSTYGSYGTYKSTSPYDGVETYKSPSTYGSSDSYNGPPSSGGSYSYNNMPVSSNSGTDLYNSPSYSGNTNTNIHDNEPTKLCNTCDTSGSWSKGSCAGCDRYFGRIDCGKSSSGNYYSPDSAYRLGVHKYYPNQKILDHYRSQNSKGINYGSSTGSSTGCFYRDYRNSLRARKTAKNSKNQMNKISLEYKDIDND